MEAGGECSNEALVIATWNKGEGRREREYE